ncbi:MAG: hypothetical protein HRT53_18015 [Colwellia sp.]|nr:hypothetical protein [Colwellia sp.]
MLKWLIITLVAIVVFTTLLLGLGYLLKEHETATTLLKQELDQQRAQIKAKEIRKQAKFKSTIYRPLSNASLPLKESLGPNKQQILLENLICTSTKQCILIDIQFEDLSCVFAINTIGASLLAKVAGDFSSVGKCPDYPPNSQLSCELNICSYQ